MRTLMDFRYKRKYESRKRSGWHEEKTLWQEWRRPDHKSAGRYGCDRRGIRTGDERFEENTGNLSLQLRVAKAARAIRK